MKSEIKFSLDDSSFRSMVRDFPKIVNAEKNKSFRRYANEFGKFFTKSRLRKGIFDVKRKRNVKPPPRGQPKLPKKMTLAGFVAGISGRAHIDGKALTVRTSSPLMLIREHGGRIPEVPKPGKFITIRSEFQGRGAAQKRQQVTLGLLKRPIIAKKSSITIKPILGFVRSFNRFQPTGQKLLDKGIAEARRRAQRVLDKRAGKKS